MSNANYSEIAQRYVHRLDALNLVLSVQKQELEKLEATAELLNVRCKAAKWDVHLANREANFWALQNKPDKAYRNDSLRPINIEINRANNELKKHNNNYAQYKRELDAQKELICASISEIDALGVSCLDELVKITKLTN